MDRTRRKTNKVLFYLEKKNYVTKTLLQIKLDDGEITSDMKKINKQIEVFFSETYKSKLTDVPLSEQELGLKDFIQNLEIPRLSTFLYIPLRKITLLVKTVSPMNSMKLSLTF